MQLHRRDNLDLLGEYLHLPPPRPRFFLDLSEFEHLLEGRGLLAAPFAGRREELYEVRDAPMMHRATGSAARRSGAVVAAAGRTF
jgi:hypothetical protein